MRQKLGVALAVAALALSGAREASDQFRQLASIAGDWASTNAWNSLLVYAAGTFDGLAPQRTTALVASNSASCSEAKTVKASRAVKPSARRPARAKTVEPLIAELALSHAEGEARRPDVREFRIEVRRDADANALALVPRFAAADFETEVAREDGRWAEAARALLASEMSKLRGRDFVFRVTQVETIKRGATGVRNAPRRKADEPRDEATDAGRDGDAQEILFAAPSGSGLLNCDEEPRR